MQSVYGYAFALAMFAAMSSVVQAEISDAEFKRLHRTVRPNADASWRSIPWKTSLLDAQQLASKEGKPIFIWAMDGHPLGCT